MTKKRSTQDKKEILGHSAWVTDMAVKLHGVLSAEVKKRPEKEQWVLYARVINCLFANHYRMSFQAAEQAVEKKEASHD